MVEKLASKLFVFDFFSWSQMRDDQQDVHQTICVIIMGIYRIVFETKSWLTFGIIETYISNVQSVVDVWVGLSERQMQKILTHMLACPYKTSHNACHSILGARVCVCVCACSVCSIFESASWMQNRNAIQWRAVHSKMKNAMQNDTWRLSIEDGERERGKEEQNE